MTQLDLRTKFAPMAGLMGLLAIGGYQISRTAGQPWYLLIGSAIFALTGFALHLGGFSGFLRSAVVATWSVNVFVAEASISVGEGRIAALSGLKLLLAIALAGIAIAATLLPTGINLSSLRHPMPRTILIYCIWMGVAAIAADAPRLSMLRVGQAFVPFLTAATATSILGYSRRWALAYATLGAATLHMVVGIVNPNRTFIQGRVTGLMVADAFGFAAALVVVMAIGLLMLRPRLAIVWLIIGSLGGWGILESQGRTAFVAGAMGSIAVLGLSRRGTAMNRFFSRAPIRLGLVAVGLAVALLGSSALQSWFLRGEPVENVRSLTGRTSIWGEALTIISDRPLLGYGAGAARTSSLDDTSALALASVATAHNAAVEALVSAGVLGGILWLVLFVMWAAGSRNSLRSEQPLVTGMVVLIALSSLTIAGPAGFGIAWYAMMSLIPVMLGSTSDKEEVVKA